MEIWMLCVELIGQTGDDNPSSEIGFMNITTWADSEKTAEAKIQKYVESFGWHLVSVEKAHVVNEDGKYGEVELEQIERTRNNPNAIILGTFHTYKTS
ncbi:MAG TPA: hypothetical protein VEK84_02970 [Terriglobales bacterium]|nr:hypothetical protein [Terriglobales bacterium]